jgi:hypothetical protein
MFGPMEPAKWNRLVSCGLPVGLKRGQVNQILEADRDLVAAVAEASIAVDEEGLSCASPCRPPPPEKSGREHGPSSHTPGHGSPTTGRARKGNG